MTLLSLTHMLVGRDTPVMQAAARTHAGMAHFAGTGPALTTCRECRFWRRTGRWRKRAPEPASCARFNELTMTTKWGPAIPHDATACKHFVKAEEPQALVKPERKY